MTTYALHEQTSPNPITHMVDRAYGQKMVRTIRGLLSYCSRTEHREHVKKALVSDDLDFKINVMKKINLNNITDFEKSSLIETYKFMAFQMGQCRALIEDGVELFTKNSVARYYPELKDYLDRKESSSEKLQDFYEKFVTFISKNYTKVDKHQLYATHFHGKVEVIDVKKEATLPPVVVFDIDGTLLNEKHRAQYREIKDWETYFNLCHLDTPIQHIIDLTHEYKNKGYEVWLMSGRIVGVEEKTRQSLLEHNIYFDHLKLRGEGNMIPDFVLKPAWISKYIGRERVAVIYDDQPKVIEGFRKKGLNVIDVADVPITVTNMPTLSIKNI